MTSEDNPDSLRPPLGPRLPSSHRRSLTVRLALLAGLGFAMAAAAQQGYDGLRLTRSVVSGGGAFGSNGGGFELSGAIGQPVTDVSSGGRFELTSGFCVQSPQGDCDLDGMTGLVDFAEFAACSTSPDVPSAPSCACYDIDSDGDVDLLDFAGFQAAFNESR